MNGRQIRARLRELAVERRLGRLRAAPPAETSGAAETPSAPEPSKPKPAAADGG